MKRVVITTICIAITRFLFGQSQAPTDTVKIQVGGENITLPMPKSGNKVTVNLEDSTDVIQISIGKYNKNNPPKMTSRSADTPDKPKKHISWLREVEIGTLAMISNRTENRNDSNIGILFSSFNSNDNEVSMMKLTPERLIPGISFGINIKEKRRPIRNSKVDFITGFKFRYSNFMSRGNYEIVYYRAETVNGTFKYFPDSVISVRKGEYRARTNFYQAIFPFMVDMGVMKNKFRLSAGLNLMVGFNSSKITANTGENLKATQIIIAYNNPQFIQFQPTIKVYRNRFSVQLSTTFRNTELGSGATDIKIGRLWHLGVGYKIY